MSIATIHDLKIEKINIIFLTLKLVYKFEDYLPLEEFFFAKNFFYLIMHMDKPKLLGDF